MKSRNNFLFVVFALVLTTVLVYSFGVFQDYFSPVKEYQMKVSLLNEEVERQKLKTALLSDQLLDYQTQVAKHLPEVGRNLASTPEGLMLRGLASVTVPAREGLRSSGEVFVEKAKSLFREKKYKEAILEFQNLVEKYPASPYVVEAHFFLAEAYFLLEDYASSVSHIETLMTLFPDHEMTGYSMLRLSEILQLRNRSPEATEVLDVIKINFKGHRVLEETAGRKRMAMSQ